MQMAIRVGRAFGERPSYVSILSTGPFLASCFSHGMFSVVFSAAATIVLPFQSSWLHWEFDWLLWSTWMSSFSRLATIPTNETEAFWGCAFCSKFHKEGSRLWLDHEASGLSNASFPDASPVATSSASSAVSPSITLPGPSLPLWLRPATSSSAHAPSSPGFGTILSLCCPTPESVPRPPHLHSRN